MKRMAMVGDFRNPAVQNQWKEVQIAAQTLGIDTIHFDVRSASDLSSAFEHATRENVEAVRVGVDGTTRTNRKVIVELAEKYRMPVIYADYANIYSRCRPVALVVASATVRFVAVAIVEVPIAGRARWFVRRPTVTDAAVSTWCFRPYVSPARSFKWIAGITR
jgi:hypothetical protein